MSQNFEQCLLDNKSSSKRIPEFMRYNFKRIVSILVFSIEGLKPVIQRLEIVSHVKLQRWAMVFWLSICAAVEDL